MIYLVVPKLIIQKTWGGDYIPTRKNISLQDMPIGQSYEFYSESKIIQADSVKKLEKYPYIVGSNSPKDEKIYNKNKNIIDLSSVDAKKIFGRRQIPNILIKFTQAKGNSYQIHPKYSSGKYKPKAESWLFFEKGKATIGLKPNADLAQYKKICEQINKLAQDLSKQVIKKQITLKTAQKELDQFIELNDPIQFVNVVNFMKNAIVEFIRGGIHHSWEEDIFSIPEGNIVFEVQQDVSDELSTIRTFDKGKFMPDGSIRPLDIKSYFKYIDTNKNNNNPKNLIRNSIRLKEVHGWTLNKIFHNAFYNTDQLIVSDSYELTDLGFRHIFVKSGEGIIETDDQEIELKTGWSYLHSQDIETTTITNTASQSSQPLELLLTYVRNDY